MMQRNVVNRFLLFASVLLNCMKNQVHSMCFFPPEYEGSFVTQNVALNNNDVMRYSNINITSDWIYPYGQCYSRNGNNVIVMISAGEDDACFRCFNLQMVSKNILLVHTTESDINSKCSSSAATVKCPLDVDLHNEKKLTNEFYSIILYRTKGRENEPRLHEFCPFDFDGDIKFDYYQNDQQLCTGYESTISQCPSGSMMNVRFKGCTFSGYSTNLECIGHWESSNKHYLAVIDKTNLTEPRYKCGIYEYDANNHITLTINNDCSSLSSKSGFYSKHLNQQIFKMRQTNDFFQKPVVLDPSEISFPSWLLGNWQHLTVKKNQIIYKDHSSFKSFYMSIINQYKEDKFVVLSRSQCGEKNYKCLWLKSLDKNILKFQISSEAVKNFTSYNLCADINFDDSRWLTQSRIDKEILKTECPINGKFFGILPDDPTLCASLASDCKNQDVMHYQIGTCDKSMIYEKRVYQCLGQWINPRTSTVYTYTKRIDIVNTYECFVGLMVKDNNNIIIREAGETCYHNLDPYFGMEMNMTESCPFDGEHEEIIVQPTQKGPSTKYETVFDVSNGIDLNITRKPAMATRKSKTTKKQPDEENRLENETTYDSTKASSAPTTMMYFSGLTLMIQSSIIVKHILLLH